HRLVAHLRHGARPVRRHRHHRPRRPRPRPARHLRGHVRRLLPASPLAHVRPGPDRRGDAGRETTERARRAARFVRRERGCLTFRPTFPVAPRTFGGAFLGPFLQHGNESAVMVIHVTEASGESRSDSYACAGVSWENGVPGKWRLRRRIPGTKATPFATRTGRSPGVIMPWLRVITHTRNAVQFATEQVYA